VLFIPYRVDVPIRRLPIANFVLLALLLGCYLVERGQIRDNIDSLVPFVLAKGNPLGLIGYIFIHGGVLHLAGNMLFLWVFGNAVCVKVGNWAYAFIFLALGAVAGIAHLSLNGGPAIGASGAINGIVGMFLVWFPTNHISLFYVWFIRMGTFRIRSYWLILLWLVFDVLGALLGWSGVAYWAHVGGFAAGFGLAVLLIELGWIRMASDETSLLQALGPRRDPDDELGPVTPRLAPAAVAPPTGSWALSLAPPAEYFVSFPCACGVELRAPRKRAGQAFTCSRCSAQMKVPREED